MHPSSTVMSVPLLQSRTALRVMGIAVLFVVLYVIVALSVRTLLVRPFGITPWNPTGGLALILLLVMGIRYWPVVLISSGIVLMLVRGIPAPPFIQLLGPCAVCAGYAAITWTMRGPLRFNLAFDRLRDVIVLITVAAVGTLLIAVFYAFVVRIDNPLPADVLRATIMRLWIGHLIGVVVFVPPALLLLVRWTTIKGVLRQWHKMEMAGQACAAAISLWIIFGSRWAEPNTLFYVLFIPLVWVSMRQGIVGTALFSVVVQFGLIAAIFLSDYQLGISVTQLQFLMLALAVTGLLMGAAISNSKVIAAALADSESRLRAIVSTAPDGIITTDQGGTIVAVNPAAAQIFDSAESKLVGSPISKMLPAFGNIACNGEVAEITGLRHNGASLPLEITLGSVVTHTRQLNIAIIRDVTRRKENERRLEEQRTEINRKARFAASGEMAAAIAHELHQPLTAIRNFAHVSRISPQPAVRDEMVTKIESEAVRASEIVKRLRDLFLSGATHLESLNVKNLVDGAIERLADHAQDKGISLEFASACSDTVVLVDGVQIEAVIHNLIRNAVEAIAPLSSSEKCVRIVATDTGKERVQISVMDTGPGISDEMLSRLFEPYATTKATGTGLGLSLSRSIVEAHGGKLWAESNPGGGTVFHFTLPRADYKEVTNEQY